MAIDYEKANTLKKLSTFQFQIFQTASICVRNVDGGDIVTRWRGRGSATLTTARNDNHVVVRRSGGVRCLR